jgi:hypothetical protein
MAPTLDCTRVEAQIKAILTKSPLSTLQGHRPTPATEIIGATMANYHCHRDELAFVIGNQGL